MFKKGRSGNPAGRPTGATNNVSTNIKIQIESILTSKFTTEQIEQDILTLEPKDRLTVYLKLIEYSIPKIKASDLRIDFTEPFKQVIRWGGKEIEL